jgi:hypothetical protein
MRDDGRYRFVTTCVNSTSDDIDALIEQAQDVSMRIFRQKIGSEQYRELEAALGYNRDLRLANDWAVSTHRSVYRGVPAYYLVWSAIEHIYTLDGELGPSAGDPSASGCLWPVPVRGSPIRRRM